MFDKITKHLDRKKAKPTWSTNGQPVKAKYYIDDQIKDSEWAMLIVDYNYYHMAITYFPYKQNKYHVWIETQCVFNRGGGQDLGTKFWDDNWYEQEDVIEYIRYKLR